MNRLLARFRADDYGVTSMEYAFIGALIFVVIITAIGTVGTQLAPPFQKIGNTLTNANSG